MRRKSKKGQSTIEVVVLVIIVAAAVLFMNRYVRRSVMGMLKEKTDGLGKQFSIDYQTVSRWSGVYPD